MAIAPSSFEVPKEIIEEMTHELPPLRPTMLDAIKQLNEEREEELLAVLAAGVPSNCISLTGPSETFDWRDSHKVTVGFKFISAV